MLYVTTRGNEPPQTALHAMNHARGGDGGLYIPVRIPDLSQEISTWGTKSFGQATAEILNLFFETRLTGWDVEFAIGRHPVRLLTMSHRILLTETWHNPTLDFQGILAELTALVAPDSAPVPGSWGEIGIRIAVLFGIFAELTAGSRLPGEGPVDISVASGDFSGPMAAVYAKRMGLPIGNIIVCCNENCAPWDLVCKGELKTGAPPMTTALPECDHPVPPGMERLLFLCGGSSVVFRYLSRAEQGGVYFPEESVSQALRSLIQVSVVSSRRILSDLPNLYSTTGRVFGPYDALTWCGLMDYRARAGESRLSLVMADHHPQSDAELVCQAMGLTQDQLNELL